ncbi:71d9ada6-cc69-4d59-b27f-d0521972a8a7 [Thermothielavioides terrestris]|uniref:Fibronectin type-III domain-containing protein n=2 Tax=Thermothielavioides terrestris TaxID=2587410 RepID=G2R3D1_THETT|nr:uncharacterized protein THITE_2113592 [Thermothielavioides terrestris NRRL 8126]AEO65942.1 hypothetical protein THITE_2113592 [Thermothielavioides terrestris NRRL 8126]SPQ18790.1 71d9ada6-cc69-4d59-b27f-d0521972a8a7 [Thermothielavioides terrestris]
MSWLSWTSLVPTFLIVSASLAWWFTEPKNARINLIAAAGAALFCWAIAPELCRDLSYSAYALTLEGIAALHLHIVIARHANMLLTGLAVGWLVRRAWQTLWKPVPELINILGVDVPEPPDVSLAEIRADAATVNWTRPPANRSVQKFLIQVNGVDVGEVAANQEPAIVVSGLKPNHFYNVRVIAVNSNNFQAGSRVIRLRTFGRDGRPQLGNARLPSSFVPEEPRGSAPSEVAEEGAVSRSPFPALEVPTVAEATPSPVRELGSASGPGPRRNTVTRRHSPSTTSLEQPIRDEIDADSKQTLPELTEKFESIRKETEDVLALIAKEEADNRLALEELDAEKREKRKEQKKKEEQTEKLKRDVNSTDRTMRNAMQRKAQKEKLLKEKQAERAKFHENIAKWEKGVEEMRRDRESFDQQMTELEGEKERKVDQFRRENGELQTECSRLEAELKERREQVKELEEARKLLPGGEEEGDLREKLAEERRDWYRRGRGRELGEAQAFEAKRARALDEQIRVLGMQLQHIPQTPYGLNSQPTAAGIEFDHPAVSHLSRRSRAGNSFSSVSVSTPLPPYSQVDPAISVPTPSGFASSRSANAPPGFAPGPFMDLSAEIPGRPEEASSRAAPLSPSATALLPSNILADLDDDEELSPVSRYGPDPSLPQQRASPDNVPLSPASSGKSFSVFSSPHGSTSNLPFPPFQNDASDRLSLNAAATVPSPVAREAPQNKLSSFFSFQRSRPTKAMEKEGLPLGSLKQGQSQSFPKQADDPDGLTRRRISLSGTWNVFNRNSVGPEITEGHATHSRMFSRSLNPFSSSHRAAGGLFPERDPSSPRPASIASSEFPRPSTDSGSIWGFSAGDAATLGKPSRLWPPDAAPWSRNPSRRPSLHGSPSALKTTLASADDEILGEEMLPNAREVGVIGSRPPTQSKSLGRLNPNAPAFIAIFKSKADKEKDKDKDKEKESKEKSKAEKKDKAKAKDSKEKSKAKEAVSTPETPQPLVVETESPSDSRKSRDGFSVHTQTSVSESRDSLSLDQPFSNTPSEGLSSSFKDDNVVRKLFRKGSSSKFSLAGRLGGKESGLFKKAPSSTASGGASDKGTSLERSSMGDFEDIGDEALNAALVGRSFESITSSPSLAPALSSTKNKESKAPARWLSNFGKKGKKEKESLDLDRAQFSELDGLAEEGSNNKH